jgi:arabinofuranosyltransferase
VFAAATPVIVVARLGFPASDWRAIVGGSLPAAVAALHLLWRHARYGAWLPNTYYAKHTGAWPESGARYLASFVLEYGLWVWVVALALAASREGRPASRRRGDRVAVRIAVAAIVAVAGYYTFVEGGDHFEYRIYAHLVPLAFVSFVWALGRLQVRPGVAGLACAGFLAAAWPIPWTHWALTRELGTRAATFQLRVPVAPSLPVPLRWVGALFDEQQAWLIERFVGMRHQEHKVLWQTEIASMPRRDEGFGAGADDIPVADAEIVGVLGWSYPNVAVIDRLGLNDAVIARAPLAPSPVRRMAHERRAPKGYVECFMPNVRWSAAGPMARPRAEPLTAARIEACERRFGSPPAAAVSEE